jgi:hypothetical protein
VINAAEWFWLHGFHVFPTVNKVPAVPAGTSQFDYRCSREQAAGFREYGVPLGLFAVADSDNASAEAWNATHLPSTPFTVTTGGYHDGAPGHGRHRYYRLVGEAPHFIHRNGHTIEFRHRGQYVVGPGSVRPDGVVYTADDWSWDIHDVPFFPVADFLWDDRPPEARGSVDGQPLTLPPIVSDGERHETLHKIMRSLVARCVPLEGALAACHIENRSRCKPPLKDLNSLDRFLRRAYQQKDRADFVRTPQTGWELAGALLDVGLSVDAALVAVRAVTPDFDPETSA